MRILLRNNRRGSFGLIALLLTLLIVGFLVLKNSSLLMPTAKTNVEVPKDIQGLTGAVDAEDPAQPTGALQHFKNEAKRIEQQQNQNLEMPSNPE